MGLAQADEVETLQVWWPTSDSTQDFSKLEANYAFHREQLEQHGNDHPDAVPIMRTVFVSEDTSVVEQARRALELQAAELAETRGTLRLELGQLDDWALVERFIAQLQRFQQDTGDPWHHKWAYE